MRSEGRQIKEGEQPMKWVKMRASTIGRMRELELMREGLRVAGEQAEEEAPVNGDAGESTTKQIGKELEKEVMQGLYALSQTELYVPDPVIDVSSPFPPRAIHPDGNASGKNSQKQFRQYRSIRAFDATRGGSPSSVSVRSFFLPYHILILYLQLKASRK
jgi:hypothetical protein